MRFPRHIARAHLVVIVAAFAIFLTESGCSKTSSPAPTTPSPTPANVAGTWSGSATDTSGPGQMTWQLTQSGASFSGSIAMTDTATAITGRGTVSGTMTGTTMQFSILVPMGGFSGPDAACSSSVAGTGAASTAAITGTYTGSSSCSGTIAGGQINLSKQ